MEDVLCILMPNTSDEQHREPSLAKLTCMSAVSLSLPPALARKPFTACT